jgi:hypothetical protein
MQFNISTNILRDQNKEISYIVTPNTTQIFKTIFDSQNLSNKSFTLIGNYGTGKSTFLWALEKNLIKEKIYFSTGINQNYNSFDFFKLVGDSTSLTFAFQKKLNLDTTASAKEIVEALEVQRIKSEKKKNAYVILIDEFGKFLEYINKNKNFSDLYLLQLIAEWANDSDKSSYFILTLHQNFISYSSSLDVNERQEWEKIKGRFIELQFNEPVEQLLYFASEKLKDFSIVESKKKEFNHLNTIISDSNLVVSATDSKIVDALFPLDWLSSNILVNALQRYGQNERSLFTFLNEQNTFSVKQKHEEGKYYTVSCVFDYLINSLTSDIHNYNNPHRPQWFSTFRAIERAELYFETDYPVAVEIIKTTCLVNIFGKSGGLFDKEFIVNYLTKTTEFLKNDVEYTVDKLEKVGIIRFYKHSNKFNFLEGTDIDIEQELAIVSKEISPNFSIAIELDQLIIFPIECAKRYSFETGTTRFFKYRILSDLQDVKIAESTLDGYINLIFNNKISLKDIKNSSLNTEANLFVYYKNSQDIYNEIFTINKYKVLIEKFSEDINALNLLRDELRHHIEVLEKLVLDNLFTNQVENLWFDNGKQIEILSKRQLNEVLSDISSRVYNKTPYFRNELANKEFLSAQINTARKSLFNHIINYDSEEFIGFSQDKYPPEKSIFISLLKETGIHRFENGSYQFLKPIDETFLELWDVCEQFVLSANSSKRNLGELYDQLSVKPFKLKKGFVDFWIPLFLIIKKEEYALFHEVNGFVPYLTDDILSLIHKAPTNYSIKSYNVSGLNINLLEGYKELVNVESDSIGLKSTFLTIFGNFLRFYKGLNDYTLNTRKISDKAIRLRDSIKTAKDPEDALFNQFPSVLGYNANTIKSDEDTLQSFTLHIQDAIREIRSAYSSLIDRIEEQIIKSFNCNSVHFQEYKLEITQQLNSIQTSLLANDQRVYCKRLISPLDDRTSWIKSVADVALGKSIDKMIDEEELILNANLKHLSLSLLKACDIHQFNNLESNKRMLTFELFDASGLSKKDNVILNLNEDKEYISTKQTLNNTLSQFDKERRKQLLIELLEEEFITN